MLAFCLTMCEGSICSLLYGDNILVDMIGNWWLGDLGSAVQVGAPVHSTTQWFS